MDYDFMYTNEVIDINTDQNKPSASVETITPELASEMLGKSIGNRSLKTRKIENLVRDIRSGNFVMNGESVIVSAEGLLMDGHHRLTACVRAGISIESVVVRGINRTNMKTLDVGSVRGIGDHLKIDGFLNSNNLASIINHLHNVRRGSVSKDAVTTSEAYEFIRKYPFVKIAAHESSNLKLNRIPSTIGAIYFVAILIGEEEIAKRFVKVLRSGIPDYDGCPAHRLRERLIKEASKGDSYRQTPIGDLKRIAYRSWEAFRVGEPLKMLRIPKHAFLTGWTVKASE